MEVNKTQNQKINALLTIVGVLGGLAAILSYMDTKKHRKLEQDLIAINKQIKELELSKLKKENGIS